MTATVRPAVAADARAIAGVHVRAWNAAYRGLLPDAVIDAFGVDVREARWRAILEAGARVLVAVEDDVVVGFCSVLTAARDPDAAAGTGEVTALYVDPPAWRRGIGGALLEPALAGLAAGGCSAATLWALARNPRALEFYAASGFHPDGAERVEHGARHVRLRARVTARAGRPAG